MLGSTLGSTGETVAIKISSPKGKRPDLLKHEAHICEGFGGRQEVEEGFPKYYGFYDDHTQGASALGHAPPLSPAIAVHWEILQTAKAIPCVPWGGPYFIPNKGQVVAALITIPPKPLKWRWSASQL